MFIETKCKECGGTGKHRREIRVGDVVTPQDGSAMCNALHRILFNGVGSSPPFKPVRVVAIEGEMLGVVPVHWDNQQTYIDEMYHGEHPVGDSACWIWRGTYNNPKSVTGAGFWIHAHVSNLKEVI